MAQSHEMRILLADNAAGTTNPITIAARSCDLLGTPRFGRDPGKRGTRQQYECGSRVLGEDVGGGFNLYPTVAQLDWIIERFLGDRISSFPLTAAVPAETIPPIYAFVDKGAEIFLYSMLYFNTVTFSLREGDYMDVRCDFVGQREQGGQSWPGAAPAIDCDSEYVASDAVFTFNSTAYKFKNLDLTFDNRMAQGQQENNLYREVFESEGLECSLSGSFAHRTDTQALYRVAIAGAAGDVTINDGTVEYEFAFANVKIPGNGPTVPEDGEVTKQLEMNAFRTEAADVVTITKS